MSEDEVEYERKKVLNFLDTMGPKRWEMVFVFVYRIIGNVFVLLIT